MGNGVVVVTAWCAITTDLQQATTRKILKILIILAVPDSRCSAGEPYRFPYISQTSQIGKHAQSTPLSALKKTNGIPIWPQRAERSRRQLVAATC